MEAEWEVMARLVCKIIYPYKKGDKVSMYTTHVSSITVMISETVITSTIMYK